MKNGALSTAFKQASVNDILDKMSKLKIMELVSHINYGLSELYDHMAIIQHFW